MYWQDKYQTPSHAAQALKLAASGRLRLTPAELHVAHVAVRSGLSGISEDPGNLGRVAYGLTELPHNLAGLKKDIKKALKGSDVAKLEKVLAKEEAKLAKAPQSKKAAKRADYVAQIRARIATVSAAPATAVIPGAPPQPIPQLPALTSTDVQSFAQGPVQSGGGGSSFIPPPVAEAVADDGTLSMPLMIGIGAAALALLYLLVRRK